MGPALARRLVACALLVACSCSGTPGPSSRIDPDDAIVRFDTAVRDAEVWVDGAYVEGAIRRGLALEPGEHRIAVRHDDYHTRYLELTVRPKERRTIKLELAEILP